MTASTQVCTGPPRPAWAVGGALTLSAVAGTGLGFLAAAADRMGGGTALVAVLSTALSWGATVVVVGMLASRAAVAAVLGPVTLVLAVLAYYGLSLTWGLRSPGGDVANATLIWSVVGVAAGLTLGPAGWVARHGEPRPRALSIGILGGLLAAQGASLWWRTHDVVDGGSTIPMLVAFLLGAPLLVVVLLARRQRLLALTTAATVAVAGAAVWSLIGSAIV